MSYDSLNIVVKPSIAGSVAKTATGAAYASPTVPISLVKSGLTFTNTVSNTASLGADSFTSAIFSVSAGSDLTVNLASLTDLLFQSGVSFARIKGYRIELLSIADDSTYGTACTQIQVNGPIPPPVQTAPSTATTGGTVAAGTYYYKVTALTALGETTGSNEESITTTGSTSTVTLNWNSVPNATGYNLYRGTAAGSENTLIKNISSGSTVTYTETGSETTTSVSPPSVNTAAPTNVAQLNQMSPLSGFYLWNGDYMEWATPSANGWVVGSNTSLYIQNLDGSHAAAVQISFLGS